MKELLKKYFGYDEFRPLQEQIINSVIAGRDTFVLMPTGGGKSLCYQLPALYFEGVTLVVSPLIALMKDQVDGLRVNGISAAFINSSLSHNEIGAIESQALSGELKILYIAPERLANDFFKSFLQQLNVSLIAIDEAHCISAWGHDFRPEYRNLKHLRNLIPNTPIIALTATATDRVAYDILTELQLKNSKNYKASFDRSNLNFIILRKKNTFEKITYYLDKNENESCIIYCFSRKDTERLAEKLKANGYNALPYHAGLNAEERKLTQERFINDDIQIITATIAFGMGIDKSNVRLIIHHTFPKSMEGYYQEVGRAGRDGLSSDCVMLFGKQDWWSHKYFADMIQDPILKSSTEQKINEVMNFAQRQSCRRQYILAYFGETYEKENCESCDICLNLNIESKLSQTFEKKKKQLAKAAVEFDSILFEDLRVLRKQLATENNVPPYVIFGDRSLQEMAYYYPMTRENLLEINGVGDMKFEKFGEVFMEIIKKHCLQNNLESKPIPKKIKKPSSSNTSGTRKKGEKYQITLRMLKSKSPLSEIANCHGVKIGTVIRHIEKLIPDHSDLDLEYLRPSQDIYDSVSRELMESEDGRMRPIFEKFNEEISYEQIRLVRLFNSNRRLTIDH